MNYATRSLLLGAGAATAVLVSSACSRAIASDEAAAKVARGKYLVEQVGMCADCHSPRNPGGSFDETRWLQGAALGFAPIMPMPVWADFAPPLAGLPSMPSDETAVQFLMTGQKPNGVRARPPMPEYHLNRGDAEAVVAYLRALRPGA